MRQEGDGNEEKMGELGIEEFIDFIGKKGSGKFRNSFILKINQVKSIQIKWMLALLDE